jgi:hypothetical protein
MGCSEPGHHAPATIHVLRAPGRGAIVVRRHYDSPNMKQKNILWIGVVGLGALAFAWVCPAMNHPQKRQTQRIESAVNNFKPFPPFPR